MSKRYNYVIGDVQGCFEALKALLKEIRFDPDQDLCTACPVFQCIDC